MNWGFLIIFAKYTVIANSVEYDQTASQIFAEPGISFSGQLNFD